MKWGPTVRKQTLVTQGSTLTPGRRTARHLLRMFCAVTWIENLVGPFFPMACLELVDPSIHGTIAPCALSPLR
jgi:hypothetical protein